jgi:hypothetical protein
VESGVLIRMAMLKMRYARLHGAAFLLQDYNNFVFNDTPFNLFCKAFVSVKGLIKVQIV